MKDRLYGIPDLTGGFQDPDFKLFKGQLGKGPAGLQILVGAVQGEGQGMGVEVLDEDEGARFMEADGGGDAVGKGGIQRRSEPCFFDKAVGQVVQELLLAPGSQIVRFALAEGIDGQGGGAGIEVGAIFR